MSFPDLNLLVYLHLLIKHGSATKVAHELNVSQPGVSAALRRLRVVLEDPVMVRSGGRLVPTSKALAIHAQMAPSLDLWERLADSDVMFDPARTTRTYSVLASDYIQFSLLPGLVRKLSLLAPKAALRVIPPNPYRRLQMVVEREADFAIGYFHEAPEELRVRRLFAETMVCVVRRGHPASGQFDLAAFSRHPHIGITSVAQGSYSATLEKAFAEQKVRRHVLITLPSYLAAPQVVLQTDYIAILPISIARSFAAMLPLDVHPSPIELPRLDVSILYHNSMQNDPSHKWFRDLTAEVAVEANLLE
jgi:DNA-binding transcriptional LysR family regulator